MAQVVVQMSSDEARLLRGLDRVIQRESQMRSGFQKTQREAKNTERGITRSAKQQENSFAQVTRTLANYAAGFVSLQTVISGANQLLAEQVRLSEKALELQTARLAPAQQEAVKNLTGLSPIQKRQVLETEVPRIAASSAFPEQGFLTAAVGAGFSASGDLQRTLSAVEAAAQLTRLTPEDVDTVAAGALDVSNASGIDDAERNLGFLLTAGAINRIEDPTRLSRSLAPLASSGVATVPKQDRQEATLQIGALFGTLARAATDTQGEATGTAATTLLAKLDQFFADRKDDPGTLFGRIEAIQQSPELRNELLGDEGFGEAKFKKPIELVLTQNSQLANELKKNLPQVSFDSKIFEDTASELKSLTPALRLATTQASSAALLQSSQTGEKARMASARNVAENALEAAQGPEDFWAPLRHFDSRMMARFDRAFRSVTGTELGDPEDREILRLKRRQRELLFGPMGAGLGSTEDFELSEQELRSVPEDVADKLRTLQTGIDSLEEQRAGFIANDAENEVPRTDVRSIDQQRAELFEQRRQLLIEAGKESLVVEQRFVTDSELSRMPDQIGARLATVQNDLRNLFQTPTQSINDQQSQRDQSRAAQSTLEAAEKLKAAADKLEQSIDRQSRRHPPRPSFHAAQRQEQALHDLAVE